MTTSSKGAEIDWNLLFPPIDIKDVLSHLGPTELVSSGKTFELPVFRDTPPLRGSVNIYNWFELQSILTLRGLRVPVQIATTKQDRGMYLHDGTYSTQKQTSK